MSVINSTLKTIREHTGLKLDLCDTLSGIRWHNGRRYFNVVLNDRTSESETYKRLQRFASAYSLISVEPNGLHRVAIFVK